MPRLLLVLAGLALVLAVAWLLGLRQRLADAPQARAPAPGEAPATASTTLREPDAAEPARAPGRFRSRERDARAEMKSNMKLPQDSRTGRT